MGRSLPDGSSVDVVEYLYSVKQWTEMTKDFGFITDEIAEPKVTRPEAALFLGGNHRLLEVVDTTPCCLIMRLAKG